MQRKQILTLSRDMEKRFAGKLCIPASLSVSQNLELMLYQPIVYARRHVVQRLFIYFFLLFFCLSGITLHLNGLFFQMLHVVYRRALHAVPFGSLCFATMKLSSVEVEISALRVKRDHCHRHDHPLWITDFSDHRISFRCRTYVSTMT